MSALASTAVAVLEAWTEGGTNGRRNVVKRVTLTLTGQGSVANPIPASALGFQKLLDSGNAVNADQDEVYVGVPSVDGLSLFLVPAMQTAQAPGDVTDTVTITVKGIS